MFIRTLVRHDWEDAYYMSWCAQFAYQHCCCCSFSYFLFVCFVGLYAGHAFYLITTDLHMQLHFRIVDTTHQLKDKDDEINELEAL